MIKQIGSGPWLQLAEINISVSQQRCDSYCQSTGSATTIAGITVAGCTVNGNPWLAQSQLSNVRDKLDWKLMPAKKTSQLLRNCPV